MIKGHNEIGGSSGATGPGGEPALPYVVEVWELGRAEAESVIGRAASLGLAHAIFTAAQSEHVGRRIVLRRGQDVLQAAG